MTNTPPPVECPAPVKEPLLWPFLKYLGLSLLLLGVTWALTVLVCLL